MTKKSFQAEAKSLIQTDGLLERAIIGGLRGFCRDHPGAMNPELIHSAAKRIAGAIRNVLQQQELKRAA